MRLGALGGTHEVGVNSRGPSNGMMGNGSTRGVLVTWLEVGSIGVANDW